MCDEDKLIKDCVLAYEKQARNTANSLISLDRESCTGDGLLEAVPGEKKTLIETHGFSKLLLPEKIEYWANLKDCEIEVSGEDVKHGS